MTKELLLVQSGCLTTQTARGFEGFFGFSECTEANDFSFTELEHPDRRGLGFGSTALAAMVNAADEERYLAHPAAGGHVGTHDLPRFAEVGDVAARSAMAAVHASATHLREERVPLDFRIRKGDQAREVPSRECIHHLSASYTVSCDIAYSASPAASRASCGSR
jgi:hypothetical protein